jgi:RND family efflux transporter MFP subunit
MKNPNLRWLVPLLTLAIIAVTIATLIRTRPLNQPELVPQSITSVLVTRTKLENLAPTRRVAGLVEPARKAVLRSEGSGRVVSRVFDVGQQVDSGALLLELESSDEEGALAIAHYERSLEESAIRRDRSLLELAGQQVSLQQREVDRLSALGEASLGSASQLGESQQRLLTLQSERLRLEERVYSASARLGLLQERIDQAGRALADTRLSAPFSGSIGRWMVEVGESVTPGQAVVELIDNREVELELHVATSLASRIDNQQPVAIDGDDWVAHGTIATLSPATDPSTHTHRLRIRLQPKGDRWPEGQPPPPGTLLHATLPLTGLDGAVTVPEAAILRDDGHSYLFEIRDNIVWKRQIETGPFHAGRSVVYDTPPDLPVVARDTAALSDGQQVVVAGE